MLLLLVQLLLLTMLLGAIVGMEREREQQNTGIRTFACICVAACLFAYISAHLTEDKSAIATGLGFIGVDIIFRNETNMPKRLTTAAGLWATSAIGEP